MQRTQLLACLVQDMKLVHMSKQVDVSSFITALFEMVGISEWTEIIQPKSEFQPFRTFKSPFFQ